MEKFHTKKSDFAKRQGFSKITSHTFVRDVSFKVWHVDATDIEYQYESGHTLSLYLKGGDRTYRYDQPHLKGQSGKLCLMPRKHLSRWHSASPIHIAHLYLPDALIRQEAERHLDIDSRLAELRDITYQDDAQLRKAMLALIFALRNGRQIDPLVAEEALYCVTSRLLECYRQDSHTNKNPVNGLSLSHRKLIKAHINDNLEQKFSLESLAGLLHLSPFHFARMFKQSFGDSPANYIVRQRVNRAKMLLKTSAPLSLIAIECGFSHQSHFTNYFKKLMGITPANYRKILRS